MPKGDQNHLRIRDLTGQIFDKLTVLERVLERRYGRVQWLCRCECGTERVVIGNWLITGRTRSCGSKECRAPNPLRLDLTNHKFGRLTALSICGQDADNRYVWWCRCDCGNELAVDSHRLRGGNTRSCGCFKQELNRQSFLTHGKTGTPEYWSWVGARARCNQPGHTSYANYGGRGIVMCSGWDDFEVFLADMGNRPDSTTLDRIDNDGGYWCGHCDQCLAAGWPFNCRWATPTQQRQNQRARQAA